MLLSIRPNALIMLLLFLLLCLTLVSFGKLLINFFIVNLLMQYQTLYILPICQTLLPAFSHLRFTSFVLISGRIPTLPFLIYHALTFLLVLMSFFQQPLSKLISESPDTHCDLDPIPSTLLKSELLLVFPPYLLSLIFLLLLGFSPISSNLVLFTLLLKSLTLMKMNCPMTDLSLISFFPFQTY
jgi:hypothetical protein